MPRQDILKRLQEIAHSSSNLQPKDNSQVAFVNLLAGIIYGFSQAAKLDYDDTRANPNAEASKKEFSRSVLNIAEGLLPDDAWLAGFYFNSSLMRMSALNARINELKDRMKKPYKRQDIRGIRRLVNEIKHEPEAQMGWPWQITLSDALASLEVLYRRLEELCKEGVDTDHR